MKDPWGHLKIFSVRCKANGAFYLENIRYESDEDVLKTAARIELCLNKHDDLVKEIERLKKELNDFKQST